MVELNVVDLGLRCELSLRESVANDDAAAIHLFGEHVVVVGSLRLAGNDLCGCRDNGIEAVSNEGENGRHVGEAFEKRCGLALYLQKGKILF